MCSIFRAKRDKDRLRYNLNVHRTPTVTHQIQKKCSQMRRRNKSRNLAWPMRCAWVSPLTNFFFRAVPQGRPVKRYGAKSLGDSTQSRQHQDEHRKTNRVPSFGHDDESGERGCGHRALSSIKVRHNSLLTDPRGPTHQPTLVVGQQKVSFCLFRPLQALLDAQLEDVRFMPRIAPSLPVDSQTPDPAYAMEHASENFITCEIMLGTTTTESYNDFSATDIQYGFEEDERNRVKFKVSSSIYRVFI